MKTNTIFQTNSAIVAALMIAVPAALAPSSDERRFKFEKVVVADDGTQTTSTEATTHHAAASTTTASSSCVWTFGYWRRGQIRVWASDSNAPDNLPPNALTESVRYACAEWSCHSGLEFVHVATEAEADFTLRWVNRGDSPSWGQWIIGDFFFRRGQWNFVIAASEVYINSNTLLWTVGDSPILLDDHWPPKLRPDGCQAEDVDGGIGVDLLASVTFMFGTGLGLEGKSACDSTDPCHDVTMNDCISRRALNPEDIAAIQSLY